MRSFSSSSGDLLADRRFAYAEALLHAGESAAAADLLLQTVAIAPDWPPAWLALAAAREGLGDRAGAVAACERATALDRSGVYGASLRLARLHDGSALPVMPPAYVAALFDDYAPRFDRHLVEGLGYRGPALLAAAVEAVAPARRFAAALDLGCGTGLMGAAIRPAVTKLAGVDLSPAMVAAAGRRAIYDELAVDEMHRFLAGRKGASGDLVLAADVFAYVGPVDATIAAAARVLRPGGLLAFTVQRAAGDVTTFGDDMRFSHPPGVLAAAIGDAGLALEHLREATTRRDAGLDVPGLVAVARKP